MGWGVSKHPIAERRSGGTIRFAPSVRGHDRIKSVQRLGAKVDGVKTRLAA